MISGQWFQRKRFFKNWPNCTKFPIIPWKIEKLEMSLTKTAN